MEQEAGRMDYERPYYEAGDGARNARPLLFYVIFGAADRPLSVSRKLVSSRGAAS